MAQTDAPDAVDLDDAPPPAPASRRGLRIGLLAVAVLVALVAAFVAGRVSVAGTSAPADDGADAGFARDMQVHHSQAVGMSLIVRDRTDDHEVRQLAYDIATTQQQQAGQMFGWLELWGLSQAGDRMAWMRTVPDGGSDAGHEQAEAAAASGRTVMPGMASAADLRRLATLSGRPAEVLYLQLMLEHHEGGVEMAEALLARSPRPQTGHLAETIVRSQTAEITVLRQMLAERGARPA